MTETRKCGGLTGLAAEAQVVRPFLDDRRRTAAQSHAPAAERGVRMRPAPSWFPPAFIAFGLALILPVLVVGLRHGKLRRTALVVGGMSVIWSAFFAFFMLAGIPPTWVALLVVAGGWSLIIWTSWPQIVQVFGFRPQRGP
jgi:hypothetical protein